jgi:hypothetical protein
LEAEVPVFSVSQVVMKSVAVKLASVELVVKVNRVKIKNKVVRRFRLLLVIVWCICGDFSKTGGGRSKEWECKSPESEAFGAFGFIHIKKLK